MTTASILLTLTVVLQLTFISTASSSGYNRFQVEDGDRVGCRERPKAIFLLTVRKERNKFVPVVQTCEWLREQNRKQIAKICSRAGFVAIAGADEACPETCKKCSKTPTIAPSGSKAPKASKTPTIAPSGSKAPKASKTPTMDPNGSKSPVYGNSWTDGTNKEFNCPAGQPLINLSARTGSKIDKLIGECGDSTTLGPLGGTGGVADVAAIACPTGYTGVTVSYENYINRITLLCGSISGPDIGDDSYYDNTVLTFTCPSGTKVSGFGGNEGIWRAGIIVVRNFYIKCSPPKPQRRRK